MNPFSKKVNRLYCPPQQPGFRRGRNSVSNRKASYEKLRIAARSTRNFVQKSAKLKSSFGAISKQKSLKCCLLNVDGLSESSFADVKNVLSSKAPDICILLETKRRLEDDCFSLDVPGYEVSEHRRSDIAGDKGGGGIAVFTRKAEGLIFNDHDPDLVDHEHGFVRAERVWKTVRTGKGKTAVCAVYAGFQAPDDVNAEWNTALFSVLNQEVAALRRDGFRVVLLGDFNGHVGDTPGIGVVGNKPSINKNGRRFIDFLQDSHCVHVNGHQHLTTGLWTRQRAGISTVLDYAVIASEHLPSVVSMLIDDQGVFGGGSDHNWIFLDLADNFVRKLRVSNLPKKKPSWNISHNQDWSGFQENLDALVDATNKELDASDLASRASKILLEAGERHIGLRSGLARTSMRANAIPRNLVDELQLKRHLEKNWKSRCSLYSSTPVMLRTPELLHSVEEAESLYQQQRLKVDNSFSLLRRSNRMKILQRCSRNTNESKRYFWSHVSKKALNSSEIEAVVAPDGTLHCSPEDISRLTEGHLLNVFHGSLEPVHVDDPPHDYDHSYASKTCPSSSTSDPSSDHPYSGNASPRLPIPDGSGSIMTDPDGWINRDFTSAEVSKAIKKLKGGKAVGLDQIPNEFLINAGNKFCDLLTLLYNKVKKSGTFPPGWNKGRVTLAHKRGPKEILGNYRPLTVIVSMSGLYSRLLNERLTEVVEAHGLLGEIQNGFRKGRMGADNSFILDTILWKQKSLRKKTHMAFIDLTKAYDMVDRSILWNKMKGFGFGGEFLSSLKSIYSGDSVQAVVNGVSTRPVYLRRGLRQGCSLSPMLFALYMADMGQAITLSSEGFRVGNVVVSGLLFADDLVLVAKDPDGLLRLLSLVKRHADLVKMEINTGRDKSEVISPDGDPGDLWQVMDDHGDAVLSLRQVIKYKYLGNTTMGTMHKIGLEKQKECVKKAHKYKGSCIFMSREGPDVVDMIVATWCNIAVPSILYGTEMIPFSETTILELERTQNQVAKYALGVPLSTAGICAQIDLGMKPFRQVLYEHQLKYYSRLMNLDGSRWVKQAFLDHISLSWNSPYVAYILSVRSRLGLYEMPMCSGKLLKFTSDYFVRMTNSSLSALSLPWLIPVKKIARQIYVQESTASSTLSQFRYNIAPIGNRYPRVGKVTTQHDCPLCPCQTKNTVAHLAMFCSSIEKIRKEQTEISLFRNTCLRKGFSEEHTFKLFVNGYDWNENPVEANEFLDRGRELKVLLDSWLDKW